MIKWKVAHSLGVFDLFFMLLLFPYSVFLEVNVY